MLLGGRVRRGAAWLALFAIWLQAAVVFPHICPDDIAALIGDPGSTPELASGTGDAPDLPLCPLSEAPGGGACTIYATAHMAGATLLSDAIKLETTGEDRASRRGREDQLPLSPASHLLFQTRAPPVI